MDRPPGMRITGEGGFTLIELLVVILIVGVLAAIALPAFLEHRKKGQDSAAKSDARNLVSQLESCHVETQDYSAPSCKDASNTGLDVSASGALPGEQEVAVTASGAGTFTVVAKSSSGTYFAINKQADGTMERKCGSGMTVGGNPSGAPRYGCKSTPAHTW